MRALVTGGRGFIGSHIVDALVARGDDVWVVDSRVSGANHNAGATYLNDDVLHGWPRNLRPEVVFHTAAIGRTPWAIADPVECWYTNTMGAVLTMEEARKHGAKRVVLSSSNIVYAAETPYKASKLAMEHAARVYTELYGLSTICLRYANTYGPRQREDGIGPNVFAALRKSHREKGYVEITGDGTQSRDFIHVSDVVRANLLAAESDVTGEYDICTGLNHSMNEIAELFGYEAKHVAEREGDIKHIRQDPVRAERDFGFKASVKLTDSVKRPVAA